MRVGNMWSRLATLGWFVSIVGCHSPGNELESVRYGPIDDRFGGDIYTVARINITYEDEHGEMYTETSEETQRKRFKWC
ncbi:unnamed protein product [Euphydryas editha]|uniref:Secreted protein n=1 Tax=Euphydryas editha TaxID=104508 RepID=A0AAU9TLB1_EUPED|nr:unnamed protein product [Euphydryas editha]